MNNIHIIINWNLISWLFKFFSWNWQHKQVAQRCAWSLIFILLTWSVFSAAAALIYQSLHNATLKSNWWNLKWYIVWLAVKLQAVRFWLGQQPLDAKNINRRVRRQRKTSCDQWCEIAGDPQHAQWQSKSAAGRPLSCNKFICFLLPWRKTAQQKPIYLWLAIGTAPPCYLHPC